jgi:hypothetical protein
MGLDTRMIPGAVPACSSTRLTHATITNQTSSHFAEALRVLLVHGRLAGEVQIGLRHEQRLQCRSHRR